MTPTESAANPIPDEIAKLKRELTASRALCDQHFNTIIDLRAAGATGAMRAAFHVNMLRAFPDKSHAEIAAEIDKAVGVAEVPDPAMWTLSHNGGQVTGASLRDVFLAAESLRTEAEKFAAGQRLMAAIEADVAREDAQSAARPGR